jgi:predicted nucleic acid-binding protein
MRVLLDTNILLRSAQPTHPLCSQATHAVSKLLRQKESIFFCAQNIAEFWNVATRPTGANGLGMKSDEVLMEISSIENLFTLLPEIPGIYAEWKRIVAHHSVQGTALPGLEDFFATSPAFPAPQGGVNTAAPRAGAS